MEQFRERPSEEAIALARAAAGVSQGIAARCYRVRRLDRPGAFYYLVLFGEPGATVSVAAVNAVSGDVENWARSEGAREHLPVDSAEARRLAGLGEAAAVELVWQPCRATRSPLYPLWEVRGEAETRYIDQQSGVWTEL